MSSRLNDLRLNDLKNSASDRKFKFLDFLSDNFSEDEIEDQLAFMMVHYFEYATKDQLIAWVAKLRKKNTEKTNKIANYLEEDLRNW